MANIRIEVDVDNPIQSILRVTLRNVAIDADAELSWFPGNVLEAVDIEAQPVRALRRPDGAIVERAVGAVAVFLNGRQIVDNVVFTAPGDMTTIGCQTLTKLGLRFDPVSQALVDAGALDR